LSNSRESPKPADHKVQPVISNFRSFNSSFKVDELVLFSEGSGTMYKQIEEVTQRIALTIKNALIFVDGQILNSEDETPIEKFKKSGDFSASLLVKQVPFSSASKSKSFGAGKLVGNISAKAYVHSKESIGSAIQAIKWDVINSLNTRMELLNEDSASNLLEFKSTLPDDVLWMLPRRVYVSLEAECMHPITCFPPKL